MVKRNDGPLTTLAFNYLPSNDDILCVYDHGGIYSDPNVPNEHLVLVHFYIIPSTDPQLKRTLYPKTLDIEVPLSDLLYFGCGSWFKDQVHRGRSKLHKKSIFSNLKTSSVLDAFVDGLNLKIYSERSFEMEGTLSDLNGGLYLKSAKGNKPVFKDVIECIRFYFSGMSKFASEFLKQMADEDNSEPLWYADETGFEDEETFVLSPSAQFASPAIALQLAIILTSPDLSQIARGLGQHLNRSSILGYKGLPEIQFPDNSKVIHATYRKTLMSKGPVDPSQSTYPLSKTEGIMIGQILSDRRDFPFKRLVIRDPRPIYEVMDGAEPTTDGKHIIIKNYNISDLSPNSMNPAKRRRSVRNLLELSEAFPKIRNLKVRVDRPLRQRVPSEKTQVAIRTELDPDGNSVSLNDQLSTGEGGFTGNSIPLDHKPFLQRRRRFGGKIFEPGERRELFSGTPPQGYLKIDSYVEALESDSRCRRFLEATNIVPEISNGLDVEIDNIVGFRSHGPLSVGAKSERLGLAAFIRISRINCLWIELVRDREKEALSLGIVTRTDGGDMMESELALILNHCSKRIALRGKERKNAEAYAGIWPTDFEYDDARGDRLWHIARRKNPEYFADDLLEVTEDLINFSETGILV